MTAKIEVRVFPDYMSSGVWIKGVNVDPEELGISPGLQLALKYWHEVWEFAIASRGIDEDKPNEPSIELVSHGFYLAWKKDGAKLVELLNAENDKHHFVGSI